ncbi:MAG: hypothetical protein JZU65_20990 [Chlorobium sp.]|nr:hypothetical protein [Chlorobium sp.]
MIPIPFWLALLLVFIAAGLGIAILQVGAAIYILGYFIYGFIFKTRETFVVVLQFILLILVWQSFVYWKITLPLIAMVFACRYFFDKKNKSKQTSPSILQIELSQDSSSKREMDLFKK